MNPADVYNVLRKIRVKLLYHANSVATSCTFLEHRGFLSRGYVEDHKLIQTYQSSDAADKKYQIWHRIFLDHVDIHYRGGRTKGPNQYGPVLFEFDTKMLSNLPSESDVSVTKKNPVNWTENEPSEKRWFKNVEELAANIKFGDFDKMLVIKTASGTLDFPDEKVHVLLDNPNRKLSSDEDAYAHALKRLKTAAAAGRVRMSIEPHHCRPDCSCIRKYGLYAQQHFDSLFS